MLIVSVRKSNFFWVSAPYINENTRGNDIFCPKRPLPYQERQLLIYKQYSKTKRNITNASAIDTKVKLQVATNLKRFGINSVSAKF